MFFGFYECTKLPMEVMPATDIVHSRMVSVFADMGLRYYVRERDSIIPFLIR